MINVIYITLGYACNMNCMYCTQASYDRTVSKDWEINYSMLDKIAEIPNKFRIVYFGGEPLVYFDKIIKITDYLKSKTDNASFGLITNGKALTVELAEKINSYDMTVAVSHDGYSQVEYRGFDPLVDNIDAYLKLNSRNLSCVISASNPDIRKVWDYVAEFEQKNGSGRKEFVHFEFIKDIHGDVDPQFMLSEENGAEFEECMKAVFDEVKQSIIDCDYDSRAMYFAKPYFNNILKRVDYYNKTGIPTPQCGINTSAMQTDIRGVLYKCHGAQDVIGHVDIDGIRPGATSPYLESLCKDCDILPYCGGGCILPVKQSKKYDCYMNRLLWGGFKKLLEDVDVIQALIPYMESKK